MTSGLAVPERVRREVNVYRSDSDLLGQWLEERTSASIDGAMGARELYSRFADWCRSGGHGVVSERRFADKMTGRGFTKAKTNKGAVYHGISLNSMGATGAAAVH